MLKFTRHFVTLSFLLSLYLSARAQSTGGIRDVSSFGAKPDGKTLNTKAINQAINACSTAGGGTVIFPAGRYLSGSIELVNNVTLQLEPGAVLEGSTNLGDYSPE